MKIERSYRTADGRFCAPGTVIYGKDAENYMYLIAEEKRKEQECREKAKAPDRDAELFKECGVEIYKGEMERFREAKMGADVIISDSMYRKTSESMFQTWKNDVKPWDEDVAV